MLEKYMGLVGNLNALSSRAEADYLLLLCFAAKVHYILHQLQFLVFWARLFASFFRSLFCYIYLGRVVLKEGVKNAPYLYFLLVFLSPFTLFFPLHSHLSSLSLYNTSRKKYGSGIDFCSWTSLNSCTN